MFKVGDKVKAAKDLKDNDTIVLAKGTKGVVTAVKKNPQNYSHPFDVRFQGTLWYVSADEIEKRMF